MVTVRVYSGCPGKSAGFVVRFYEGMYELQVCVLLSPCDTAREAS